MESEPIEFSTPLVPATRGLPFLAPKIVSLLSSNIIARAYDPSSIDIVFFILSRWLSPSLR